MPQNETIILSKILQSHPLSRGLFFFFFFIILRKIGQGNLRL